MFPFVSFHFIYFKLKLGKQSGRVIADDSDDEDVDDDDNNSVNSKFSDISTSTQGTNAVFIDTSKNQYPFEYAGRRPTLDNLSQTKADLVTISRDETILNRLPLNASANEIDRCVSLSLHKKIALNNI